MVNKSDSHGEPIAMLTPSFTELDIAFVETEFDRMTNIEEKDIKTHIDLQNVLKRYLAVKLALFPANWLLLRVFLGKNDAKLSLKLAKEFWKLLRADYIEPTVILKYMDYTA